MRVLTTFGRHRSLAVFVALVMWLAQPALAFCPCLAANATAKAMPLASVDQGCTSSCCEDCVTSQPDASGSNFAPVTASCPAFDAALFHQAVTPERASPAKGASAGVDVDSPDPFSDSPSFARPDFGRIEAPPDQDLPRSLASLVARRCHPCHAPPFS